MNSNSSTSVMVWYHTVLVAVSIVGGDEEISVVDGVMVTVYIDSRINMAQYNDYNLQYMTASDYKHTHLR